MIVNLYVDHMASTPPASSEEVWNATREHAKLYSDAAKRMGLTQAEYQQFRNALLDGKATYVTLPRRLDAMAGSRRGSVYVVKNAYLTAPARGWRVALADGNIVYVPQACGNLSVLRPRVVAHAAVYHPKPVAYVHANPGVVPAVAAAETVPPPTPVTVVPEQPATEAVAAAPAAAPAAARGASPLLFLIPAALGGIIAGIGHGSPHQNVPPCAAGSNAMGACTTSR